MKIALCFWGLCRSTQYTVLSIRKYIFNVLKTNHIQYDTYLHTYTLNTVYNNGRANEHNIQLDNDEWKLLKPDFYTVEDQNERDKLLELEKFRTKGNPWGNNSDFNTLDNHIRALWSLYQVTQLWKNKKYDLVIYLRPDVMYLKPLDVKLFKSITEKQVVIPNFHLFPINDRFAIGMPRVMTLYGERFLHAYNYSLEKKLHSETYLKYILEKNKISIIKINFNFCRIRANGDNFDKGLLKK